MRRLHPACVLAVLSAALALHGPAILTGRVLLPADVVLLMRPWTPAARERFPEFRFAQNQLLGPIFEYYSWRHYARTQMREGRIPLWNPYEMGGNVLLANSQSAVLYPPNVLLYLLPLWVGINLVTLLHSVLTGIFMLGFLRSLGLRHVASLSGALTWMLCGTLIVWTEFQTPTAALCWLPGVLWASELWLQRGCSLSTVTCGFLLAASGLTMSLIAGHPQFAFYVVLAAGIWIALRAWSLWGWPGSAAPVACIGVALILGACTLLPVAEATRINHRDRNVAYADAVKLRLPAVHLTSALLPNVRGNPRDYVRFDGDEPRPGNPYIGPYDFTEYCLYGGIPALVLGLLGLIWGWRQRGTQAISALGLLGLALALGTPLGAVFFYLVPGYAQFHAPARALCLVHFALAALAGIGVNALLERVEQEHADGNRARALRAAIAVTASVALLAVLAWPVSALQIPELLSVDWLTYQSVGIRNAVVFATLTGICLWFVLDGRRDARGDRREARGERQGARGERREAIRSEHAVAIGVRRTPWSAWALPALCAFDLLVWSWAYNPATDPAILATEPDTASVPRPALGARAISFESPDLGIKGLIVPNYNAVVGYREVQGADSVHTRRYHRAMETIVAAVSGRNPAFPDGNTVRLPVGHHPLFNLMNVTHVTTAASSEPPASHYVRESEGQLTIWRNTHAIGPGRIVCRTVGAERVEDAVQKLSAPDHDWQHVAIVEGNGPELDGANMGEATAGGEVSLIAFSPHRVEYDVVSPRPGLFVSAEVAYPGWRARVSERAVRTSVADGILRAAMVPEGASRVVFSYEPSSFRIGLYLSLIAVAAGAGLWAGVRFVGQRRGGGSA